MKFMKVWVVFMTTPYGKETDIFGVFDSKEKAERARKDVRDRGRLGGRVVELEMSHLEIEVYKPLMQSNAMNGQRIITIALIASIVAGIVAIIKMRKLEQKYGIA